LNRESRERRFCKIWRDLEQEKEKRGRCGDGSGKRAICLGYGRRGIVVEQMWEAVCGCKFAVFGGLC